MVEGDEIAVLEGRVGAGASCAGSEDGFAGLGDGVIEDGGDGMSWVWIGAVRAPSWWWGRRRGVVSRDVPGQPLSVS